MYHSRSVDSNQTGIHDNLDKIVQKHIATQYRKPIQSHNLRAFQILEKRLSEMSPTGLVLDSCCGTAMSSVLLARQFPEKLIVGVDQSAHRLTKTDLGEHPLNNCLLLRANCEDIWRMCVEAKINFDEHYILYPNPWPKSVHLKRRWHGHPVFPVLNQIAKRTILRSNWMDYLNEFQRAWQLLTGKQFSVTQLDVSEPLTLFEKKYSASGQQLYQLICEA